jgi:NADH-quinone oxidoreductase subunit L
VEPLEYLLMALSVLVALAGIGLARAWYTKMPEVPKRVAQRSPTLYRLLLNKYYVDEVYDATVVTPLVKGSESLLWKVVDVGVIDGLVNGTARAVAAAGRTLRMVQTGVVHNYMLLFIAGVVMILGWLIAH